MDLLEQYTLQELFFSCCIAVVVLIAMWECGKKLSEIANAYFNKKYKKKEMEKQVIEAVANDGEQDKAIKTLVGILKVQIRHSIVRIAEESLCVGKIGSYELKSLEELYECYGDEPINGNSYVGDLMTKVRALPIDTSNGNP